MLIQNLTYINHTFMKTVRCRKALATSSRGYTDKTHLRGLKIFCLTPKPMPEYCNLYDVLLITDKDIKRPVAKAVDIGSKRLINLAPDAWLQWVTQRPEVVAKEILGSEFQWISRETDVLVKAYSPTHGDF